MLFYGNRITKKDVLRDVRPDGSRFAENLQTGIQNVSLHPDEEYIVVSHTLFLMMSKPLAGKLPSLKGLFLLRKLEEDILTTYLTESDEHPELLRYCNLLYDMFPYELAAAAHNAAIADRTYSINRYNLWPNLTTTPYPSSSAQALSRSSVWRL